MKFRKLNLNGEYDALQSIYTDHNGPSWTSHVWTFNGFGSTDVCIFDGITCDVAGFVIEIDLSDQDFTGYVPTELSSFSSLHAIELQHNTLSGTIPNDWLDVDTNPLINYIDLAG